MIKRSFFLLSTATFFFWGVNGSIASDSFTTHTQHTPMELKPVSFSDMDNSYKTTSVCFLGGNCGDGGKFNKGDDYELDTAQQCKNEGFIYTSCTLPTYLEVQCLYNSNYYAKCTVDNDRACKESGYDNSCDDGYVKDNSKICPYDASYYKCKCNPCDGYTYTYEQATAEGYVADGSCISCGTTKYKRKENSCSGYTTCECGGEIGASICYTGNVQKFNKCKSCCATNYTYNTTNCDQTKNIFCGNSCGGRYEKCRSRPFIGSTVTIGGTTFAEEESLCPGLKKYSGRGGFGYTDILTGKNYWVGACASTTQACLNLSEDIKTKSVVTLSEDINCENMNLSADCNTITIKGNGHTLYMNDGISTHIMQNCSSGTFRLENLIIDIKGYWYLYISGGQGGCADDIIYAEALSNVEISDVIIRTSIPIGDLRTVKVYGKSFFEGRGSDARLDYGLSVYGTLNMKNIYVMEHAYPHIYGTLNYKGDQLDNVILDGGTVNACVNKVVLSQCTSEASGTVNYSGAIDLSKCNDKSRITFNHVPDLCSSNIFSGAFWN